jgi:hypothetical protein
VGGEAVKRADLVSIAVIAVVAVCALAAPALADVPPPESAAEPAEPAAPVTPAAPAAPAAPAPAAVEVEAAPVLRGGKPAPRPTPAPPRAASPLPAEPPPSVIQSRIPEIVATVVTLGLAGAMVVSIERWDEAQDRRRAAQWEHRTPEEHQANIDAAVRWRNRSWALIGGTFASTAITAFLWARHQTTKDFSVQPTDDGTGASVSFGGRF